MYLPAAFREMRPEMIEGVMAAYPLANLVTAGPHGLDASHIPLLYDPARRVLRGHMARANPQWRQYPSGTEALAIFSGPQHYISPAWYPSKTEHGKVVPTWNYVVVHVHGMLRFPDDPEWLLENVRALTDAQEASNETPWSVSDAPPDFITSMLNAIVGVEMAITAVEGKWKVSQNRSIPDRHGVISALGKLKTPDADRMAELVKAAMPAPSS